jgi:hypothetical protein
MEKIAYDIYRLLRGSLFHAVPKGQRVALCGKKPAISTDWSVHPGAVVTCPRCMCKVIDS